jgi:hypothetical protein
MKTLRKTEKQLQIVSPRLQCYLIIILLGSLLLSNGMLPVPVLAGSDGVPYEEGGRQEFPSAAARLCELACRPGYVGVLYSFRLEVLESCWEPVYALEIEEVDGTGIQPAGCPNGWTAVMVAGSLRGPKRLVFSTSTRPIMPGAHLGGFSLLSSSTQTTIRWYPTNSKGILIGKVTRQELYCTTGSGPRTWGMIKAHYR